MNRGEMHALLIANLGDNATSPNLATAANAPLWLNAAMRCVANWADAQDQMLFHTSAFLPTTGVAPSSGYHTIYFSLASGTPTFGINPTNTPFRRLLGVMTETAGSNATPLQIVEFEKREQYFPTSTSSRPPVCILSDGIMLLNPTGSLALRIHFVQSLPDMTTDSDTPGQIDGVGRANLLPVEYHPLVVAYATVFALASENSDARQWIATRDDMQSNLLATLAKRRGARVDKT